MACITENSRSLAGDPRSKEQSQPELAACENGAVAQPLPKPLLAAGLTALFGCILYATVLWWIGHFAPEAGARSAGADADLGRWPTLLLLMEAWFLFQHGNVLANPMCQHLDRQYGIALLRNDCFWAIAGTLVGYWSREIVCLLLCTPFVTGRTQYMVLYSALYHLVKSAGVSKDAARKWSPPHGIMRIVIDRFYFDTLGDWLVSLGRIFLQGSDTLIHACVVRDLYQLGPAGAAPKLHALFLLWLAHAALNQATRKSTATVVVETWVRCCYGTPSKQAPCSQRHVEALRDDTYVVRTLLSRHRSLCKDQGRTKLAGTEVAVQPPVQDPPPLVVDRVLVGDVAFVSFALVLYVGLGVAPFACFGSEAHQEAAGPGPALLGVFLFEAGSALRGFEVLLERLLLGRVPGSRRRPQPAITGALWNLTHAVTALLSMRFLGPTLRDASLLLAIASLVRSFARHEPAPKAPAPSTSVEAPPRSQAVGPGWGFLLPRDAASFSFSAGAGLLRLLVVNDLHAKFPQRLAVCFHVLGLLWVACAMAGVRWRLAAWWGRRGWRVAAQTRSDSQPPSAGLRAVLTLHFGLVAHCLVTRVIFGVAPVPGQATVWLSALFAHEAWVLLQHLNVLANPACQRLDRQYGIALLQKNHFWAIAGTLSAYWSREILSLLACIPHVGPGTQRLVIASSAYHFVKIRGVIQDAARGWSPAPYGIMRIVIDRFHLGTGKDRVAAAVRLALQAGDTLVHLLAVRELSKNSTVLLEHVWPLVSSVWVAHAVLNQATRCSTATLFVEMWKKAGSLETAAELEQVAGDGQYAVQCLLERNRPPSPPTAAPPSAPDVVFLGHPARLVDTFGLFAAPSAERRWQPAWWMHVLWPVTWLLGLYLSMLRRRLTGRAHDVLDDCCYGGIRVQTWVVTHFGRHFTCPTQLAAARLNVEAAAQAASAAGAKVLCLGALNKAEALNGGGVGLLQALPAPRRMRVAHGNHLTAAAVVEAAVRLHGTGVAGGEAVFVTGASSKTGRAVALALSSRGVPVLCHSSSPDRRQELQRSGLRATACLSDGACCPLWVVGKSDPDVCVHLPHGAAACVFAVPSPLHARGGAAPRRPDVRVVEAATLQLDVGRLSAPRRFTNLLRAGEMYACQAAAVVQAAELRAGAPEAEADEVGEVDPGRLDECLRKALALGFRLPPLDVVALAPAVDGPPVVVIGGGASGLATAACLRVRGLRPLVLEQQPAAGGSWDGHFSGLTITTRREYCALPHYPVPTDAFPAEYLGAEDYLRYLRLYARRFRLEVRCGAEVCGLRARPGGGWEVQVRGGESAVEASAVVVAMGRHRTPRRELPAGLEGFEGEVLHSSELRGDAWLRAMEAALRGELLLVGFGNSAADIASAVLRSTDARTPGSGVVHVAVRRVPHIVRRPYGPVGLERIASLARRLPAGMADWLSDALMKAYYGTAGDAGQSFPPHLPRWTASREGRVPTIDKHGLLQQALAARRLQAHGPIAACDDRGVRFEDAPGVPGLPVPVSLVVLCTGYTDGLPAFAPPPDASRGSFRVGFSSPRLLPLRTIGEEAQRVAKEIDEFLGSCRCRDEERDRAGAAEGVVTEDMAAAPRELRQRKGSPLDRRQPPAEGEPGE